MSQRDTLSAAKVAIVAGSNAATTRTRIEQLAKTLALPIFEKEQSHTLIYDLFLVVGDQRLGLRDARSKKSAPVYVDFVKGRFGRRLRTGAKKRDLLARAVAGRGRPSTLVDATAGLARDGFLLASLGWKVTAIERSPILVALIRDALDRAQRSEDEIILAAAGGFKLVEADACDFLKAADDRDRPDVVYLDPMFPSRRKSALVKKEMLLCRRLVGADPDEDTLLKVARQVARTRVVVKRHPHSPRIAPDVTLCYEGKMARFDVYGPTGAK